MDRNNPASVTLVPIKAHTSVAFRAATADLAARTTDPARIASFTTAGFSLLGGGRPIVENGTPIGAIGAGGGRPGRTGRGSVRSARAAAHRSRPTRWPGTRSRGCKRWDGGPGNPGPP